MESRIRNLEQTLGKLTHEPISHKKSLIEQVVEDNTVKKKAKEKEYTLQTIQDDFETQAKRIGIDLSNFTKVVTFAIKFVADNALNIGVLFGSAITGSIRFDLACKLVASLFADVFMEIIMQSVENTYQLIKKEKELEVHIKSSEAIDFPLKKNLESQTTLAIATPKARKRTRCVIA